LESLYSENDCETAGRTADAIETLVKSVAYWHNLRAFHENAGASTERTAERMLSRQQFRYLPDKAMNGINRHVKRYDQYILKLI
jgi:hypothetical protein